MEGDDRTPLGPPKEKIKLDAIARRYGPALRGYFANRARNPADVDDLVQEVFLQLLRRGSDRPVEHMEQYLFQVAASVLADQGRQMKARRYDAHDSYDEELHAIGNEISLTRIVIGQETLERLNAAIQQLPRRTRDVFYLRGIRQRKHQEIADMLGISRRIVHKHMNRALRHLNEVMKE